MAVRQNPKREKQIEMAQAALAGQSGSLFDPAILFGRASNDDIAAYTPDMLAAAALHAARN